MDTEQIVTEPKPISEKQPEANRRKALRSTGPRTEEGKCRSSLNALRHGLTGQVSIMPPVERTGHDKFFLEYIAFLKPETPVELKRAKAMETSILTLGHSNIYRETPEIPEEHPARDFPTGNGFEFSVEQIDATIERAQRVKEARILPGPRPISRIEWLCFFRASHALR